MSKLSIRKNVFETNSSSMHAIVMDGNNGYADDNIFKNLSVLEAQDYSLSWSPEPLITPFERLTYLWTAIDAIYSDEEVKEWEKRLIDILDLPKDVKFIREFDKDFYLINTRDTFIQNEINTLIDKLRTQNENIPASELASTLEDIMEEYEEVSLVEEDLWNDNIGAVYGLQTWIETLKTNDKLLKDYIFGKSSIVFLSYDSVSPDDLVKKDSPYYDTLHRLSVDDDIDEALKWEEVFEDEKGVGYFIKGN